MTLPCSRDHGSASRRIGLSTVPMHPAWDRPYLPVSAKGPGRTDSQATRRNNAGDYPDGVGQQEIHGVRLSAIPLAEVDLARAQLLDSGELQRAARLRRPQDRNRFMAGRIALRLFAAALLEADPAALTADYSCPRCGPGILDHGRPGYRGPAGSTTSGRFTLSLKLSLSRSGPWALMAGSTDPQVAAVGVDLQQAGPTRFAGFDEIALSAAERRRLVRTPPGQREAMRTRLWVRKEALLKAAGTGLLTDPSSVDATENLVNGTALIDLDPALLGLPMDYAAALAVKAAR